MRSNYYLEPNAHFYEHSLKLWEGLSADLNFNVMFSQRGVLNLAHSYADLDAYARRGNAMRLNGIDAELLLRDDVAAMVPLLDCSPAARYPIMGGLLQRRGGIARHDAVAWGYARGADARGVDIIQQCEVTGFQTRRQSHHRHRNHARHPTRKENRPRGRRSFGPRRGDGRTSGCRSKRTCCRRWCRNR